MVAVRVTLNMMIMAFCAATKRDKRLRCGGSLACAEELLTCEQLDPDRWRPVPLLPQPQRMGSSAMSGVGRRSPGWPLRGLMLALQPLSSLPTTAEPASTPASGYIRGSCSWR